MEIQVKPSSLALTGVGIMRRLRFGHVFAATELALAIMSLTAVAQQAEDRKAATAEARRTDLHGDPLPDGAIARLGTLRDNIGEISGDIVLSPDGKMITATSEWFSIPLRLWDLKTGRVIRHLKHLENPAGHAKVCRVAFSPDGKLVAAGDSRGTVRIGATDTGRKIRELAWPESVACLAFQPDGKSLVVGYQDGAIWLYRLATGERVRSLAMAPYYGLFFANMFSPDGSIVSVRRLDSSLSLRDVLTGRELHRLWKEPVPPRGTLTLGGQPLEFTLGDGQLRASRRTQS